MTDIIHSILSASVPPPNRTAPHTQPPSQSEASAADGVVTRLNPAATYLSEQGMDFANASVQGKSELRFNMHFAAKSTETVTAQGRHSQKTGEFDISIDFAFTSSQKANGSVATITTEGQLRISGQIESRQVHIPRAPEENLVSLLRRVIKDLGKLASTRGGGDIERVLTEQQLDKLTDTESAEAQQKLSSIVEILVMIAKLKQALRDDQQPTKLAPEQGNTGETVATAASSQLTHFRLEIRDYTLSAADLQMPGKTDSVSLVSDFDGDNTAAGDSTEAPEQSVD
ncbi:hypothetical protein ACFL6E_00970 [Candidatus Neomarinimicrobiota bacterium]